MADPFDALTLLSTSIQRRRNPRRSRRMPEADARQTSILAPSRDQMSALNIGLGSDKMVALSAFGKLLERLFKSTSYSDVTLYLGPSLVECPAHYNILSVHTSFFDKARMNGFKEGQQNEFHLEDHSTFALHRMLEYMYTGDYSAKTPPYPSLGQECEEDNRLTMHCKLYEEAEYFQVKNLKHLCVKRFEKDVKGPWPSGMMYDAIKIIYGLPSQVTEPMRRPILRAIVWQLEDLMKDEAFITLLKGHVEFGIDLLGAKILNGNDPLSSGSTTIVLE